MSAKLFNIPANTLRPGPTLTIVRQSSGGTTATMDFTCRKFDIGRAAIQSKLVKGNTLISLYPEVGVEFGYLKLDSWTSRDEPGGITTVTCDFSGVVDTEDPAYDASVTYTRNNALKDEPIFKAQGFRDLSQYIQDAIKAVSDGQAYFTGWDIKRITNDQVLASIGSDDAAMFWYDLIVRRENTTYLVATSEWTKTATGRGGLPNSQFSNFGKIVNPPGSPGAPPGHTWLFTGATEQIQVLGDGANSYSLTFTSGPWPVELYGPTT